MNSIMQLLRRPWKTLLGFLLSLLSCTIICVCLGQYIASVQTQLYVENNYTTVGLLTSKYMTEEILDESGNAIGVTYWSEQPMKVQNFLNDLSQNSLPYVKNIQQNLLTSGYLPDVTPLNYYGTGIKPVFMDADATNSLDIDPYTYAMFVIKVDEVGDIRPFIDYETSIPIDVDSYGCAIDLTGVVLETRSLQQGYSDPIGRNIQVTVRFAYEEDALAMNPQIGQEYLICGTDYWDLDAQLRLDIARKSEIEISEVDWSNIQLMTEAEKARFEFDCAAIYINADGNDPFLSTADVQMIDSCSLTVCTNPLLYRGNLGQEEIALGYGTALSVSEYCTQFKDSDIVLLDGSANDFLNQTKDMFWQKWLNTASINDHSFPILAVDSLNAVSQFAIQDAIVVEGRAFTQAEAAACAKLCVISEALAVSNGLSVGESISMQFYGTDMDIINNQIPAKLANPNAAYFSNGKGFSTYSETYEIVGLYRQNNQWAEGTYCFTPNTIFVPQSTLSGGTTSICGGIYTSVILENGTTSQLEQLAVENDLDGLFVFYDQGYSQIMANLQEYYKVGHVVLLTGLTLWIGIALLFLFLFPYQLRPDLKRMWDLGTPPPGSRHHIFVSSAGILLPGTVLGCIASVLLFKQITQYIAATAKSDLTLEVPIGSLGLVAAVQMLVMLATVYSFAWIMTASLIRCSRRK